MDENVHFIFKKIHPYWILVENLIEVVDKVVRGGEARKRKAKELGVLSSRCIGGGGGGGRYQ